MSSRKLFGTDGIRGPAGQYPLDQPGAFQIGKAIGTYFAEPGEYILIGRDPRESSPALESAVIAGVASVGIGIKSVGVIPTPGLAYLTQQSGAQAGVMITASHNQYTDNGIKLFSSDGGKLPDNSEAKLNELIAADIPEVSPAVSEDVSELVMNYVDFLIASVGLEIRFNSLRLGVDMANGATSFVAAKVFTGLGAEVIPLFDKPDGKNINAACGATDPSALQEVVKQQGLDGGIAFDGDGDRVMLVDRRGRVLSGDHMLYILALGRAEKTVVATIMSNRGLESALKGRRIALVRTAVGDRYVLEELEKTGLKLGGEQSGHIILTDYLPTGDGLLAAVQTLGYVIQSGKSLADWYDELPLVPQALVNIPLQNKQVLKNQAVIDFIAAQSAKLGDSARLSIRPSGTEPKLRVMVEAADAEQKAEQIASELQELLGKL